MMRRRLSWKPWIFLALWTVLGFAAARAEEDPTTYIEQQHKSITDAAKKVSPSVVNIQSIKKVSMKDMQGQGMQEMPFGDMFPFFGNPYSQQMPRGDEEYSQMGQGSGFIVDKEGHILTNNHVVGDADEVRVTLEDKREFKAKVVGADPQSDIAVIKIEGDNLVPAEIGDSDSMEVGAPVIAVGNPFGFDHSVTFGIVSAKGRWGMGAEGVGYEDYIQTDAAINPGNSGGPLCNLRGQVIGINVSIYTRSGGYMGIGFAIPINMAKGNMAQLIEKGKVVRGWLGVGIQSVTPDHAQSFGYEGTSGALVGQVFEESPAQKAGIQNGDIITEFNGVEIKDSHHLMNLVANADPGSKMTVVVFRKGEKKRLTIQLDERPATVAQAEQGNSGSAESVSKLGIEVQSLTQDLASELGYEGKKGVVVSDVKPASEAARKGVRPGDLIDEVNRNPVENLQDFKKAVDDAKEGKVLLHILNKEGSVYVVIPLEDKE